MKNIRGQVNLDTIRGKDEWWDKTVLQPHEYDRRAQEELKFYYNEMGPENVWQTSLVVGHLNNM